MADCQKADSLLNLESLRKSLVLQEDTIVFCLIERSNHPFNSWLYKYDDKGSDILSVPLLEYFIKESEALQAKAGRYTSEEENAFFPEYLPSSIFPSSDHTQVLHPAGACININEKILNELYLENLLPLIAGEGNDANYASTATSDLNLLQALSRRIHFGKFVAEVKFRDAPDQYIPSIRAKDKEALMKLLTFETVEDVIKKRVEKKAKVFGQDVDLTEMENKNEANKNYKVDPSVVYRLYDEWVIPFTKFIQVEYLLCRLD